MKFLHVYFLVISLAVYPLIAFEEVTMSVSGQIALKDSLEKFAIFFTNKNVEGIGTLLADDFVLFDPSLKWVKGKKSVLEILKKQFAETKRVSYEVINVYEEKNVGIIEFKIALDDVTLDGVDFIEFENGKMIELRCYYNPPNISQNTSVKPLSTKAQSMTPGSIYEHYKGKRYKILSIGRQSETLEENVIYQALYGENDIWVRPLNMFLENVIVDGKTEPRFELIHE